VVYIYVSSHFVAKIHIDHLKFQAGVFYIEKKNCVLVNCDVFTVYKLTWQKMFGLVHI
jgi:hypothetical protein